MEVYRDVDKIPHGDAGRDIASGCLILEGGAWRGIYTQGALDAMMQEDINLQTVIGVSAGAMSALSYLSGQIGRAPRFNLSHRHDPNYIGIGAMRKDHGITGFTCLYTVLEEQEPLNRERFNDPRRKFFAVATNCRTGQPTYFDRDACDIERAVQASATVPYVSQPVMIDGEPYLDGGCSCKIPMDWALEQGFQKIVVIRTRDRSYRKDIHRPLPIIRMEYSRKFPLLARRLQEEGATYNILLDRIDQLEQKGRVFVLAPSKPVDIARFEGDMDRLGALYWQGYNDARKAIPAMKKYLGIAA